ncbi:hypothetical protein H6P81_014693 [Aristolochia fimbriata]|uniref:FLZ-type domain-containing protein n=1 Tax=Aristolochia fimbriata TaxID=158543 RepID=A0AAV7E448_ARIFI|nr:hypothetical protein H6P81_014693 [Aristolochia fimbriata]
MAGVVFSIEPEDCNVGKIPDSFLKICSQCGRDNESHSLIFMYSDKAFCSATCFMRQKRKNDLKEFGKAIEGLMKKKKLI